MYNILFLICMFAILAINLNIFKDFISAPIVLTIVWIIPVFFVAIAEFNKTDGYQYSNYALVFLIGIIVFDIGYLLVNKQMAKNSKRLELKEYFKFKNTMYIVLLLEMVVFLIFIIQLYLFVKSHFQYNFWFTYKWSTRMGLFKELAIVPIFRTLSRFLVCLFFVNYLNSKDKKDKKLFYFQLILTSLYCFIGKGRTEIFTYIIPLFIIYILMRRKSVKKVLCVMTILVVLLFAIFLIYTKLKFPYQKQDQTFYLNQIENYLSGGTVAFCKWAESEDVQLKYGACSFRFIFAVLSTIGFNVPVESFVEPYAVNINGNIGNVYTFYKWYANDFGIIYALIVQFVVGILHGFLYKKMYETRNYSYLIFNALLYFALFMQFFMDEYFSMFSIWLQYYLMNILFLRTNLFFERKKINLKIEE